MKRFRTNMGIFLLLPSIVTLFILMYLLVIYTRSNPIMNMINIGIDGVILLFYLMHFCYMVRFDGEWILFYTPLKRYSLKRKDLGFHVHSAILTKFVCKSGTFYMPTTKGGSQILADMFKDFHQEEQ